MAFDLQNLSKYTDELSLELISKAVLNTNLLQEIDIRTGLSSGTVALNLFDGDLTVTDKACGWSAAGDITPSQVDIVIKEKSVKMDLCPSDLRDYYMSQFMSASAVAGSEEIPFEQAISEYYVTKIIAFNENFIINGDSTVDGLTDIMTAVNGANLAGGTIATWTPANALAQALAIYDAIAESVINREDIIMVMSPSYYRTLTRALVAANLFHYDSVNANKILILPGTNCKVVKSQGLIGSEHVFAGPASFMVAGTGLLDDTSNISFFYDQGEDTVKMRAYWRLGIAAHQVNVFATNKGGVTPTATE